ncbi:hypothetical protein CY34DRAFT_93438, partial [Suillus luteus UH-Slu-Lm8-n1]
DSSWTVNRKQFPLRLACGTTFNGCRGLTLSRAEGNESKDGDTLCLCAEGNENQDCANVAYKSLLL